MVVRRIPGSTRSKSQLRKLNSEKKVGRFGVCLKNGDARVVLTHYIGPPDLGAHFIYTSQPRAKSRSETPKKRKKFLPFLATFGHFEAFPDLWRHTQREFLSVSLDFTYRPNETFCSRTHRFGCGPETLVSWRGRKVHRNGDYNAAHVEFCRSLVTPSGPPSALASRRDGPSPLGSCWGWRCLWYRLLSCSDRCHLVSVVVLLVRIAVSRSNNHRASIQNLSSVLFQTTPFLQRS